MTDIKKKDISIHIGILCIYNTASDKIKPK